MNAMKIITINDKFGRLSKCGRLDDFRHVVSHKNLFYFAVHVENKIAPLPLHAYWRLFQTSWPNVKALALFCSCESKEIAAYREFEEREW